mgnify:CR=1 FL=1
MTALVSLKSLFRRQAALPQEHGAWVFLLSPLLIGLFAGERWSAASTLVVIAALAAFLVRQPVALLVKIASGRRARRDLPAALFWALAYTLIGLAALAGLVAQGHVYQLSLALPGLPVFAWHLWLISRRAERRQVGVELVASGVLWALTWLQSAASIVYAYLRLAQRELPQTPSLPARLSMAGRALAYTSFNLAFAAVLALGGFVPPWLPLPYALQWAESLWGALRPALGARPTAIGVRQLIVSALFTGLFILAWGVRP